MEENNYINSFCLLKDDFIHKMCATDEEVSTKAHRPYLIIELNYNGNPQLFGIPLRTNINKNTDIRYWHKLPSRLETEQGYCHGVSFTHMIPITLDSISGLKGTDSGTELF